VGDIPRKPPRNHREQHDSPGSTRVTPVTGALSVAAAFDIALACADDVAESDLAAVETARTVARSLDQAAAEGNVWAVAQVSGRLSALLRELKLTPAARAPQVPQDPLTEALAAIDAMGTHVCAPAVRDDA
jgi:hypothetical protein